MSKTPYHTDTFIFSDPLHLQGPKHQKGWQLAPHNNLEGQLDTLCMLGLGLFLWESGALLHIAGKRVKLKLSAKSLHSM